jgi:phosphonate transport system substrate-binding protein
MKQLLTWFFILIAVGIAAPGFAKNELPASVTIGFIPGEDPEWLKKNGIELAKVLQQKLGVPINIYISKDYSGLTEAMREKKIDFAFFSARTFVDAEKKAGAKVLLKKVWDGPFYYSAIITIKKTGITNINGLKGKRFGYVDKQSASGHLYPLVMLMKRKVNPDTFFKEAKFFGQHEASVKALVNGDVDAVAVYADDIKGKTGAWTRFAPAQKDDFKVLWVSDPIPNDPFCVRQDFYDEYPRLTHDMMFALIDFRDEPAEKNILKNLYGIKSMDLATSKQYDPVRELVKYLDKGKSH